MTEGRSPGEVAAVSEGLRRSLCIDDEDQMEAYHRFIQDGKDAARQGDLQKGLDFFKKAFNIHRSQKLESRIKKIEELLSENDSEEEEEFVNVNNSGLMLYKELYDKLYDYQKEGVAFLYSLYRDRRGGGILADDMGLGKTIQVISFLSAMYDSELTKHTLLVMPTSLITNWTKEFTKWTPGMRVKEFHGVSKGERTRNLEKVQRRSGVIITTYTMLMNNWQQLASYQGKEFTWDYMILDEAHKIKTSSTKTAKSAYAVPSKNRVLLTGTPVQNNLREMWALFDFACQGTLLGTAKTFKAEYENPITRAREKDATPGEMALGTRISENLMSIINPYFLRRTKAEVQKKNSCNDKGSQDKDKRFKNSQTNSGAVMPKLTRKNDLIIWVYLSSAQEDIYRQFLSLDHIKELLMTVRSPLAELNLLKKLCDHPRLLSFKAFDTLGLEEHLREESEGDVQSIASVPDHALISESGKLSFLFELLEHLRGEGHRTLVFAHYRKVLDIIERILGHRGFKVLRLDGTITQIAERERRISLFQTDKRYSVFLLTTQVGGVGITLTAANRVVIYDPSWNPATDAQAVDRAYRIGQKENVIIYRLITCGTVEEKIYRRQVFKDSLIRQNTGDKKNPFRYFSKQELKELFILEDTRSSATQKQLQALHSQHRRSDPDLDLHIAHLHSMDMFGISDHDLMFSLDINHDEAPENQEENHYIQDRVQKAQELMKAESELQMQLAESMGSSTEAAWLRLQADNHSRERSQEKKPRKPKASATTPQQDHIHSDSSAVVDLDTTGSGKEDTTGSGKEDTTGSGKEDATGSGKEDSQHSHEVIDLTQDKSMTEEQSEDASQDKLESPEQESCFKETTDSAQQEPEEVLELSESMGDAAGEEEVWFEKQGASLVLVESADDSADFIQKEDPAADEEALNQTPAFHHSGLGLSGPAAIPLHNQPLSTSRARRSSSRALASSAISTGFKSYNSNFDLQLEDSDMFADLQDPEAEDKKLQLEDSDMNSDLQDPEAVEELHLEDSDMNSDLQDPEAEEEEELHLEDSDMNSDLQDPEAEDKKLHLEDSDMNSDLQDPEAEEELHLEDSDIMSEHGDLGAEEEELLSRLQMEGSFDVSRSLSEKYLKECSGRSFSRGSEGDASMDESIVATKKKRTAVIYDSDEDEEEEEMVESHLENSFQVVEASTPKSAPPSSLRLRRSVGRNTSVASQRSSLHSVFQDEEEEEEEEDEEEEDEEEEDSEEEDGDSDDSDWDEKKWVESSR